LSKGLYLRNVLRYDFQSPKRYFAVFSVKVQSNKMWFLVCVCLFFGLINSYWYLHSTISPLKPRSCLCFTFIRYSQDVSVPLFFRTSILWWIEHVPISIILLHWIFHHSAPSRCNPNDMVSKKPKHQQLNRSRTNYPFCVSGQYTWSYHCGTWNLSIISKCFNITALRDHEIWDQFLHHGQEGVEQPEIWVVLGRISGIQRASQRINSWLGEVEVCNHILYFIVLIRRLVWIIKPI